MNHLHPKSPTSSDLAHPPGLGISQSHFREVKPKEKAIAFPGLATIQRSMRSSDKPEYRAISDVRYPAAKSAAP